jgi:hypothetical protein
MLALWDEREQRFTQKVAELKAKKREHGTLEILDLVNAEAKLAQLKECRQEFMDACDFA